MDGAAAVTDPHVPHEWQDPRDLCTALMRWTSTSAAVSLVPCNNLLQADHKPHTGASAAGTTFSRRLRCTYAGISLRISLTSGNGVQIRQYGKHSGGCTALGLVACMLLGPVCQSPASMARAAQDACQPYIRLSWPSKIKRLEFSISLCQVA